MLKFSFKLNPQSAEEHNTAFYFVIASKSLLLLWSRFFFYFKHHCLHTAVHSNRNNGAGNAETNYRQGKGQGLV